MNRVHEQCLKIDSGTVLSQNWVKHRLSAPSAQSASPTSTPRCAQAHLGACIWPCRGRCQRCVAGLSWPCRRRPSAVSQHCGRAPRLRPPPPPPPPPPPRPARAPHALCLRLAQRQAPCPVPSQITRLSHDTNFAS